MHCWHDYDSNPKKISIHSAAKLDDFFTPLKNVVLKKTDKLQTISINACKREHKFVKMIVEENFGGKITYINHLRFVFKSKSRKMTNSKKAQSTGCVAKPQTQTLLSVDPHSSLFSRKSNIAKSFILSPLVDDSIQSKYRNSKTLLNGFGSTYVSD